MLILNSTYNKTYKILKPETHYRIHIRTMFNFIKNTSKKVMSYQVPKRTAVTKVAEKPSLTEGEARSYDNNPVVKATKYLKGKTVGTYYTRHPELSQLKCSFPGCDKKVCTDFCAKPLDEKPKSVGHVTHGSPEKSVPYFDKDLNNKDKPENLVVYKKPHETASEINENKTKTLQEDELRISKLQQILKKHEKYTDDIE